MATSFDASRLSAEVHKAVMRGVISATEVVRAEAVRLVLRTAKTGHLYGTHRASAPGEPWASNTGYTVSQIKAHYDPAQMVGRVTIDAEWGPFLELGTMRMQPRPVLRPAITNTHDEVTRIISNAVAKAFGARS